MKKLFILTLILATVSLSLFATEVDKSTLKIVNKSLDFAVLQSMEMFDVMEPMEGRLPRTANNGELVTCDRVWWTSGFYPGTMWYLYEYSNRDDVRKAAEVMTSRVEKQQFYTKDHDVGFVINCSYGNGYRLTKNPDYRTAMINAAKSLSTRFDPIVGCTRSWENRKWDYVVIIDNMMNLEMLTSAAGLSGDPTYYNIAKSHADVTLANHFRDDASTYHLIGYDSISGEPKIKATHQGYSDDSAWSRGQAWALYGYVMMYRQTGDKAYLDIAIRVGEFIMNHPNMPKDKVPYWDFDLPTFDGAPRDASAAAIMASAYIELSQMIDGELSAAFLDLAEQQIRSLSSPAYLAKLGENNGFLLKHSTGFFNKNSEVDEPLSYADYYYVEAMMRYLRLAEGRDVVDVSTLVSTQNDRMTWIGAMTRIADPVLENMSKGTLAQNMPVESRGSIESRKECTYLEALGRTLTGMAPWLELGEDESLEGQMRAKYIDLALKSIANGVDLNSPDYLNFSTGRQPLVDAAFLAHALLRAPNQLMAALDPTTKERLIKELQSTRYIQPGQNNWMLFSAMVECTLMELGAEYDARRLQSIVEAFSSWYKGDGWYGDGDVFHLDYYNSYVIHPMLMQVLDIMDKHGIKDSGFRDLEKARYSRYAAQQEMLISPEGTYPMLGRSTAYRFGAFHALSDAAYRQILPAKIEASQVRSALTAVINKQLEAEGTFDNNGWLRVGFYGHQPKVGEVYISTGSLYLCSAAFVALGLAEDNEFWASEDKDWTQKKIWSGDQAVTVDSALK